jgi:insertion element IS1 protein InsB
VRSANHRSMITRDFNTLTPLKRRSPDDLNVKVCHARGAVQLLRLETEADEMWSFVVSTGNKQWVWIAIDGATKQVIAIYVGDRSASSARQLWRRIPQVYRAHATFYADGLAAYKTVLPSERRQVCAKSSGYTNMIERFNCTLRRRISRLMRGALSFSRRSKTISERSSTSSVIITRLLSGLLSHLTFVALPFV